MGSALGVWKELGICLKRNNQNPLSIENSFEVDGMICRIIADPEHLIKNSRCGIYNEWTKHKSDPRLSEAIFVKYKDEYGLTSPFFSWQHIEKLYEFDSNREFKYAPRLNSSCFDLKSNYSKMNVPTAMNTFSQEVATGLKMLVAEHGYDSSFLTTAFFCEYFGKWASFITSRSSSFCLSYKDMDQYRVMTSFLIEFMTIVDSFEFRTKGRKPWQTGIIATTTSIMEIAKELLDSGKIKEVKPGRFGSGPCETLFSCIRSYNVAPTCKETTNILRVLSFISCNKTTKDGSYLNDEDGAKWIAELKQLKAIQAKNSVNDENAVIFNESCPIFPMSYGQEQIFSNVLGYTLKVTICSQSFCEKCKDILTTLTVGPEHKFIDMKQYRDCALKLPSKMAFEMFRNCESAFHANRKIFVGTDNERQVDQLSKNIYTSLLDNYKELDCHLLLLIKRFFKLRMCYLSKYLDDHIVKVQKEKIRKNATSIEQSSKSMGGYHLK